VYRARALRRAFASFFLFEEFMAYRFAAPALGALVVLASYGCQDAASPVTTTVIPGGADAGGPVLQAPPDAGTAPVGQSDASASPVADAAPGCFVQPVDTRGQAPELLILLDQSSSMDENGRWQPSVAAVSSLVDQYDQGIALGLSIFPAGKYLGIGFCDPGELDVPMALDSADAIKTAMANAPAVGATPTMESLQRALTFLGPRNETAPDQPVKPPAYVLLVTDGVPTCGDLDGSGSAAAAGALAAAGIKVFVVGYQIEDTALMDRIAAAGGTERFYAVEQPEDLTAAFAAITKDVVRCDFDLATTDPSPDPTRVFVSVDGIQKNPNDPDGWVIDGRRVTLQGAACTTLKDGGQHTVSAELRCEEVPPLR
jgi:Mg-chelatase subunit ChlD